MSIAPIQMFVVGFPSNDRFAGRIVEDLDRLRDGRRNPNRRFAVRRQQRRRFADGADVRPEREQRQELGAVMGALIGLGAGGAEGAAAGATLGAERAASRNGTAIAKEAAAGILEDLPEGSSALVLFIEHRWAFLCATPSVMPVVWPWHIVR